MAKFNKDTQNRIDALAAEKDIQKNMATILTEKVGTYKKLSKFQKELVSDMKGESDISAKLTKHISTLSMQGIIEGISSGKTVGETLKKINDQIENPKLVVNTAYNQFSNSLTTMLADELPANTKWIYVGANDAKTRPQCREKIAYSGSGGKTKAQIVNRFGDMDNEIFRCRHRWTQRGDDPDDQNYNPKEAVE